MTTALLVVGTGMVGAYLTTIGTGSVTGAAGGILLVLVWIYEQAQIVLAGAELTCVLGRRHD